MVMTKAMKMTSSNQIKGRTLIQTKTLKKKILEQIKKKTRKMKK